MNIANLLRRRRLLTAIRKKHTLDHPWEVESKPKKNMVLPSYEEELLPDNSIERQSMWQDFYNLFKHSINQSFHYFKLEPRFEIIKKIEDMTKTPYDVQRVVIVGVHGWFPHKIINMVLGDVTGTSTNFSNRMKHATAEYLRDRFGIILYDSDIDIITLEGEGTIEERVRNLYGQLTHQSHLDKIKEADLVVFAAHSQGYIYI
jgi:hypothetical protein